MRERARVRLPKEARTGPNEKHGLPRVFRIYFRFIMPADRVRIRVTHKTPPSSTGEEGGLGFLRRLFLVTSPNPDGGGWDGRQVVSFVVTLGASVPVPPQSVSQSVSQSEPSTVGREQRAYYTRVGVLG